MRRLSALILLASPLLLGTRLEQPTEGRAPPPVPVQAAFDQHCGACHRSDRPTAKPKALAIFDLTREGWLAGMTEPQVKSAIGRMKGISGDGEEARKAALSMLNAELARRKGE